MAIYRRRYVPGGTYFFTLVTYQRKPLFSIPKNIILLRKATRQIMTEMPFKIIGAVVLPEHLYFIWKLPPKDTNYSKRIGRLKVLFTKSLSIKSKQLNDLSISRQKHRESNVWQRRFWEHTIRSDSDLENHLNYIHYNPVKHGLVSCPHLWQYSSFHDWVKKKLIPKIGVVVATVKKRLFLTLIKLFQESSVGIAHPTEVVVDCGRAIAF